MARESCPCRVATQQAEQCRTGRPARAPPPLFPSPRRRRQHTDPRRGIMQSFVPRYHHTAMIMTWPPEPRYYGRVYPSNNTGRGNAACMTPGQHLHGGERNVRGSWRPAASQNTTHPPRARTGAQHVTNCFIARLGFGKLNGAHYQAVTAKEILSTALRMTEKKRT